MLDRSLELRAGLWAEPPWYPKPVKLLLIQLQVASSLAVGVDALVVAARAALAGATRLATEAVPDHKPGVLCALSVPRPLGTSLVMVTTYMVGEE